MESNSPLERRYSFNATQIQPMAESTCLSWNGNNSQARGTFRWGVPTMSSKYPKNKTSNGKIAADEQKNKYSLSRLREYSKSNVTKIEPRIYVDVQSRGLSSRIVKYHENGTRLNRSVSACNLHSKPGQFPVVHLRQTPLPVRAIKHTLSMTRIPPPEKLIFQGNTLPSLLRSTSVLGVNKTDENLSHENRPILHPPPTKDDLAPTRSVLDVLKEISRKRINNEDLSEREATSNFKRQREINVNGYVSAAMSLATTSIGTTSAETPGMQNGQSQSPEQPKKKRVCNYSNNDITSSLSSSMKRKLNDKKSQLNQTKQLSPLSSPSNDVNRTIVNQRSKMLKRHSPTSYEKMLHLQKPTVPITPIPDTPQTPAQLSSNYSDMTDMMRLPSQSKTYDNVQRCFSEPIVGERVNNANSCSSNNNNNSNNYNKRAARVTLFNKNYEENDLSANESNDNDGLNDSKESNGSNSGEIQFVKPKKCSFIPNKNNPLLEKNQKSKLALMLQSLKGDLYGDEDDDARDELDSLANSNKESNITSNLANITHSQSKTIDDSINYNTVTASSSTLSATSLVTATVTAPNTASTLNITNAKSNNSSPLVGLKLDKTNSGLSVTANHTPSSSGFSFQPTTVTITTTTNNNTPNNNVPAFSFGLATKLSQSTTTTTMQTTSTPLTASTSTAIISPLTSATSATSILNTNSSATTTNAATTNNLTFGFAKQIEKSADVTFGTSTNLITFDSSVAPTTATTTATIETTTANQVSIPMMSPFSFTSVSNTNKSNQNITSNTIAKTTTSAASNNSFSFTPITSTTMPAITFSQLAQSSNLLSKTTTSATTTTTSAMANADSGIGGGSGGFSFNSSIRNATQSSSNNNNKPAATTSPFSFGGALMKSNNASKTFNFGVAGTTASTASTATAATVTSQNTTGINAFSFGNSNAMANMKTATTVTAAAASSTPTAVMQAPSTFNTFAGMVKKSSTSIFDSAVQPTFNTVNGLGTATAAATTTTNQKTNTVPNIFGSNLSNATTTAGAMPAAPNSIFGAVTQTSGAVSAQDARKGFSFGSVLSNNNNNTTIFGNLSQQSTIGNGNAATTTTSTSNGTSTNIFAAKSTGSATAFNQNKPFTFGSNSFTTNTNNNNNSNNNVNGNLFKNAVKSLDANPSLGGGDASGGSGGGGFAFGSTSFVKPFTATSSAPSANSVSFTSNNNNNNATMQQNIASAFTFGSAPAIPQMSNGGSGDGGSAISTVNKPFTFGSSLSTPMKGSGTQSVFGASSISTSTFSFGGIKGSGNSSGAVAGAAVGATAIGTASAPNIFAANLTNSLTPTDRPIRRATRRLQK